MNITEVIDDLDGKDDPDKIIVELTVDALKRSNLQLALESKWMPSGEKDWMYRVDPENPSIPLKRHVHIAKSKHTGSKNMQASWNDDGTRHDNGSFNTSVGDTARVREIARTVLKLSQNITLESVGGSRAGTSLIEEAWFSKDRKIAYVSFHTI